MLLVSQMEWRVSELNHQGKQEAHHGEPAGFAGLTVSVPHGSPKHSVKDAFSPKWVSSQPPAEFTSPENPQNRTMFKHVLYNGIPLQTAETSIMKYLLTIGLLLAGFSSATAQDHGSEWIADFDKAVEIAKAQDKDLFVDFSGSDW